jgi:hypothetical protein
MLGAIINPTQNGSFISFTDCFIQGHPTFPNRYTYLSRGIVYGLKIGKGGENYTIMTTRGGTIRNKNCLHLSIKTNKWIARNRGF